MTGFEPGRYYGTPGGKEYPGLIKVLSRTDKSIKADRTKDYGVGGDSRTSDMWGEHRYKIYIDQDGDEYTIVDRFRTCRYEVWGTKISSNPDKADQHVYISG